MSDEEPVLEMNDELDVLDAPESMDKRLDLGWGAYDSRGEDFGPNEAYRLGLAYGDMIEGKYVVGRDHREDSLEIKNALIQGLEYQGVDVVDVGLAPTDMVSYTINQTGADGGVAVTASHMPPGYHGLKPLNSQGRIFDGSELDISTENYLNNDFTRPVYQDGFEDNFGEHFEAFIDGIVSRYDELFESDLSDMSIGVDPGHGMGSGIIKEVLEELGAEVHSINDGYNHRFPDRDPDPTEDSLEELSELVLEKNLDMGVATDGDADRAVYINEKRERVSGDESLAILSEKYLNSEETDRELGIACSGDTSFMVQEHVNSFDAVTNYQPVGAVFPAKAALKPSDPEIVFGGQPNGHYLDPGFTPYDSGTLMSAVMPGIINEKDKKLSEVQNELPEYITYRENIETEDKNKEIREMKEALESYSEQIPGITKGMRNGQLVTIRPSGTEEKIRRMIETPHPRKTGKEIDEGRNIIELFTD